MTSNQEIAPEHTAVRVALWRALHHLIDDSPYVMIDALGEKLVNDPKWRERADMEPNFSKQMRASVTGRARYIEDLLSKEIENGIAQYVILGAGLDTLAQRNPDLASRINIYEVDQPGPQKWKINRLQELGLTKPNSLHFVPVDFEKELSWWDGLLEAGFNPKLPTLVASTGVSMYLSHEANFKTLKQLSQLVSGSILAMTFMLDLELLEANEKSVMQYVMKKASESNTPFLSLFKPADIVQLAKEAGFKNAFPVLADDIFKLYFARRTDGLNAGQAEAFLIAKT